MAYRHTNSIVPNQRHRLLLTLPPAWRTCAYPQLHSPAKARPRGYGDILTSSVASHGIGCLAMDAMDIKHAAMTSIKEEADDMDIKSNQEAPPP